MFLIFQYDAIKGRTAIFETNSTFTYKQNPIGFLLAGIFVGIGTNLGKIMMLLKNFTGNGCTSGHGVCGLPRSSIRSLAAVCSFMGMGMVTASAKYYLEIFESKFLYFSDKNYLANEWIWNIDESDMKIIVYVVLALTSASFIMVIMRAAQEKTGK